MATYSGARSQHQTLTAGTVDVVTLDVGYPYVEVIARPEGAAGALSFTIDTGDANQQQITPTFLGAGTYYVGANGVRRERDDQHGAITSGSLAPPATTVRVVSNAAVAYSVTGCATP